jgi:dihydrofolate reductase
MGRKTFESIGKPLPGRVNIVVTRNPNYSNDAVKVAHSFEQALSVAQSVAELDGADEVMVIGGAELYALALAKLDRLYLTHVWADVEGDAFLPELTLSDWRELAREDFKAEGPNPYDYSFVVYERA